MITSILKLNLLIKSTKYYTCYNMSTYILDIHSEKAYKELLTFSLTFWLYNSSKNQAFAQ